MYISGLTSEQIEDAARQTGVTITPGRQVGSLRLRLAQDLPKPVRPWKLYSQDGRINGVCWHGFRAFFTAVYAINPTAHVWTSLARWSNKIEFERTVDDTPLWNASAQCRCGERDREAAGQGRWYEGSRVA